MSTDKKRILLLISLMIFACLLIISITLSILYNIHIQRTKNDLVATARSQAKLIEAVAEFDREFSNDYPGGAIEATMSQIIKAHKEFVGFGNTGEFTLAKKEGDLIVFQFRHRLGHLEIPDPIPFKSELAEPMRRALLNQSSTMIGLDYRGERVIAAYEPVKELGMGIVAKIDIAEVQAPYIQAGIHAALLAFVVISLSAFLFNRIGMQLILKLEKHAKDLEKEVEERKEYEKKLIESEEKFKALFQKAPIAYQSLDKTGRLIEVNDTWCEKLGYEKEEVVGKKLVDFLLEEDKKKFLTRFDKLRNLGNNGHMILKLKRKDGNYLETEYISRISRGTEGDFSHSHCILNDLTEKRKAEEALRVSEKKFKDLFEYAPVGRFRSTFDENRFLDVNQEVVNITGYEKAELFSNSLSKIWQDPHEIEKMIQKLKEEKYLQNYEVEIITKNGETKFVSTSLRYDKPNNTIEASIQDISSVKKAEMMLMESEEKLRNIIEGSSEALIFIYKYEIELVNGNFQKLFELEVEDLKKRRFLVEDVISPEEKDAFVLVFNEWKKDTSEPLNTEFTSLDLNHVPRILDVSITALPYKDGQAYLYIFRDITYKKSLEEQLHQSIKLEAIGRLVGGIAHDFNNLLTVILGQSDFALNQLEESDPIFGDLKEIRDSALRASDLTRQLLVFGKKQNLKRKRIDLNTIVNNMTTMFRRIIGENIDLVTITKSNIVDIYFDPSQVEQIIMNLVVNAKDAMPEGGKLTIETFYDKLGDTGPHIKKNQHGFVVIRISDSGTGISKAVIDRIFDPFFTTKDQGKGTGLGLATVKGIIEQNNGMIEVESKTGQGTTFKVYFPTAPDEISISDEEETFIEEDLRGSGTVLIVEDEDSVRQYTKKILEKAGYKIIVAETGEIALKILTENKNNIDLIITDVIMPSMSGIDLISKLNENGIKKKHIFVSGYNPDTIFKSGIMESDTNYLQKPFTYKNFLVKVKETLAS